MSPLTETDWHRRLISAFIRAEPIEVQLQRPLAEETLAGGTVKDHDQPLPIQVFRLTPFKRRLVNDWGLSSQGQRVKTADWVLHGDHDADVKINDHFRYRDHEYLVIWVNDHNLYRTAAGLKVRGRIGGAS